MSTFTARYRSRCESCDNWINEGDEVRWAKADEYDRGGDVVVHVDCREKPDSLAVTREPCGSCFTVPACNGECGCDA